MATWRRTGAAAVLVSGALTALFLAPRSYFVPGTIAVMSMMVVAAYSLGGYRGFRPSVRQVALGAASALLLYLVFYAGNGALHLLQVPGLGTAEQASIYSLISSPSNPAWLQLVVLLFDAVGYESFFRGVLQDRLQEGLGGWAVFGIALLDAGLHVATFNFLWVATTFVADLAWGLTYYSGKGLPASLTSHLVWDVAIFVIRPIS